MSRGAVAPLALVAVGVGAVLVAASTGRPVWAAALGAGLAFAYWGLEVLAWRRAQDVSFNGALAVALGGMALRLAAVLGVLIVVGLVQRTAFATVALSFLAAFTVYVGLRLFTYPSSGGAERRQVRLP